MKKYLMTGMAAVVFAAAFTSCSNAEDIYNEEEAQQIAQQQIQKAYEAAFIATFGQPAKNQTWGFDAPWLKAGTRTVSSNGNEWAAPKGGNWAVPPALTDRQKEIVRMYFQSVKNPSYTNPGWTNYFMQQVYKGGTNPGSNSAEQYKAADNNTMIVGSNNMDHLAAVNGDFVDHIKNFNHGDCGAYDKVLDNENNGVNEGPWHSDQINLMTESTTASFGYYNSNSSVRRTEYTGLVSWKTIYNWAVAQGISDASVLDDGWNRSYMGFDFEMMVSDEIYAKDWSTGNPSYFKADVYGEKYPYMSSNMNMYCGTLKEFNDLPSDEEVAQLLADGYLPVENSADKKWVKVGGTADGYYSDWIVTLTEAKKKDDETDKYDVRIMVEDLNAKAESNDAAAGLGDSDWDFNDVVFDVKFTSDNTCDIRIVCIGGVLPLTVAGQEVHGLAGKGMEILGSVNLEIKNVSCDRSQNGKDIPVMVDKGKGYQPINAFVGEPAAKLCVPATTAFMAERVNITTKYPSFVSWVKTNAPATWYAGK